MGNRGHIVIEQYGEEQQPVVLYSHWKASSLPQILADALAHEERWGDHEYLSRIIFEELSDVSSDFTGLGIGTQRHGDTWRVINVDPDEQEVYFEGGHGYSTDEYSGQTYTFEEFIDKFEE